MPYKILKYSVRPPCLIIATLSKRHVVAFCMNENWHSLAADRPNRKIRHLSNISPHEHTFYTVCLYIYTLHKYIIIIYIYICVRIVAETDFSSNAAVKYFNSFRLYEFVNRLARPKMCGIHKGIYFVILHNIRLREEKWRTQ